MGILRKCALVACAAFVTLVLAPAAVASAAMSFVNQNPAPGTTVSSFPVRVGVHADSDANFPYPISGEIYVDGALQSITAEYLGHWEDDGCDTWFVVDDFTVNTMDAGYLYLPDGDHVVLARTTDASGPDETTWSFTVAAPPQAGGIAPMGYTLVTMPQIKATVTDNGGGTPTLTMRLDGNVVSAAYNSSTRVISYTPPTPLGIGVHNVELQMRDTNGNQATQNWTFNVRPNVQATIANELPVPGTTFTTAGFTYGATATSLNDLVLSSARIFIDGYTPYAATITQPAPNRIEFTGSAGASVKYADGPHVAQVRVTDIAGIVTQKSWNFTIAVPPTIRFLRPGDGDTIASTQPTIGLVAVDNAWGSVTVRMSVDGVEQYNALVAQESYAGFKLPYEFDNDTYHVVSAEVTDAAGYTATETWGFRVLAPPEMASPPCDECHGYQMHDMATCDPCHGTTYHAAFDCSSCHGGAGHGPELVRGKCEWCHTTAAPLAMHDAAATGSKHVTTTTGCEDCHDTSLLVEHAKYPTESTVKYDCVTCHGSTEQRVVDTIAANSTACVGCHDGHAHPEATVAATPIGDQVCGTCHSMDLFTEHRKPTSSSSADPCGTCHGAEGGDGGPREAIGTWDGTCSQPACHGPGTTRAVHDNFCFACHDTAQGTQFNTHSAVDFKAPAVELTRCAACHWKAGHFEHGNDRQCNSCHYALPARTQAYSSVVPTAWGWFSSAASIAQSPEVLHSIHANGSWPAGVTKSPANSQPTDCASCHAAAACEACHGATTPHGPHTNANAAYPARTYRMATGKPAGPGPLDTTQTRSVTCAAAACHDLGEAAAASTETRTEESAGAFAYSGSWWTTSSSYASGGAMRYASKPGSVVTISFTGPGTLRLYGRKDPYSGRARFSVDGGPTQIVDLYSGSTAWKALLFDTGPLAGEGTHTLRIEPDGTRNASAMGSKVQLDYALTLTKTEARFTPQCGDCHSERSEVHW